MMNTLIAGNDNEVEEEDGDYQKTYKKYEALLPTLPRNKGWITQHLVQYQGFWLTPEYAVKAVKFIEDRFNPQPDDILLSSFPKSGTTWLRALIFSLVNRKRFDFSTHPLLTTNPHDCFPFLDSLICGQNPVSELYISNSSPIRRRLFATHIPYSLLPESRVTRSTFVKIVHVCRNPKDVFVSTFFYFNKLRVRGNREELSPLNFEEAFEMFCDGVANYGPYWDHVLEYWKASIEFPENVLFLKYEDLKKDPSMHLRSLAKFLGQPFSAEEEEGQVVQEIVKMCSFENLSKVEVNSESQEAVQRVFRIKNSDFFRKGQVGDSVNYLTTQMMERLDRITADKFRDSGLKF